MLALGKGGAAGLNFAPFAPSNIFSGTWSIGVLYSFAGFIGFEATTIYSEEARDPHITVPKATFLSVLAIGIFYSVTSWLMVMGILAMLILWFLPMIFHLLFL